MQGNLLFEYAVVRIVPHVEREEFVNTGVVLYCAGLKFLKGKFELNESRVRALCSKIDTEEIRHHIDAFDRICRGGDQAGPIGKLSLPERFRWLTSTRSTVFQTSRVHPGLCSDPEETLEHLFQQLVSVG